MNGNHVLPAAAAIALALLFPLYWMIVLVLGIDSPGFVGYLREDMLSLSFMDALFLLIGLLEIYVYYSLIQIFKERLSSQVASVFLFVIIGSVFIFHSVIFADLFLAITKDSLHASTIDIVVNTAVFLSIAALAIYTVAGIGLGIVLLVTTDLNAPLLKAFAIVLLVICLLQVTILFAMVNLLLFPIALVILALYFFKDPETLEVI